MSHVLWIKVKKTINASLLSTRKFNCPKSMCLSLFTPNNQVMPDLLVWGLSWHVSRLSRVNLCCINVRDCSQFLIMFFITLLTCLLCRVKAQYIYICVLKIWKKGVNYKYLRSENIWSENICCNLLVMLTWWCWQVCGERKWWE